MYGSRELLFAPTGRRRVQRFSSDGQEATRRWDRSRDQSRDRRREAEKGNILFCALTGRRWDRRRNFSETSERALSESRAHCTV